MSQLSLSHGMAVLGDELTIDADYIDWYWFVRTIEGETPKVLYCQEKEQLEKYKAKLEGNLNSRQFDFQEVFGCNYSIQSEIGPFTFLSEAVLGCVDTLIFRVANKL